MILPKENPKTEAMSSMMRQSVPKISLILPDHHLLSKAREITEEIIDVLHHRKKGGKKPRTYRQNARKAYLKVAQNKNPSNKTIRKGIKLAAKPLGRCQLKFAT